MCCRRPERIQAIGGDQDVALQTADHVAHQILAARRLLDEWIANWSDIVEFEATKQTSQSHLQFARNRCRNPVASASLVVRCEHDR